MSIVVTTTLHSETLALYLTKTAWKLKKNTKALFYLLNTLCQTDASMNFNSTTWSCGKIISKWSLKRTKLLSLYFFKACLHTDNLFPKQFSQELNVAKWYPMKNVLFIYICGKYITVKLKTCLLAAIMVKLSDDHCFSCYIRYFYYYLGSRVRLLATERVPTHTFSESSRACAKRLNAGGCAKHRRLLAHVQIGSMPVAVPSIEESRTRPQRHNAGGKMQSG